ncbi:RNA 2',3'-cyclic phosphodiesterase [Virgibacillus senegalensis]|uniref:RNA 2',3'-cyclic phosphodiesterase n=1 Tax=Virgibacillus senegalensis TaxID=1499679 RepID=UPI00069DD8A8|nr:RNA 2',3'-cyclic phosphodiesterase [Virgibacillus senegalensis]
MAESHYFIAIPLDENIQQKLKPVQEQLKKDPALEFKNWTHPQDLHITLKFLGASADNTIKELKKSLQQFHQSDRFSLEVRGIGHFGNPQKPRVVWAGVEKTSPLTTLQKEVESLCLAFGWTSENRPYRPHITLAKKWAGTEKISTPLTDEQFFGSLLVDRIHLYQIHPAQNPKYDAIEIVRLK